VGFRINAGYAEPLADTPEVPPYERFYAGGRTLRGFDFRGMGPHINGRPTGGEWLFIHSVEYEYPIVKDLLGVVAFVDGGTLGTTIDSDDAFLWRLSVGFGLRIKVPLLGDAPLAFDFGSGPGFLGLGGITAPLASPRSRRTRRETCVTTPSGGEDGPLDHKEVRIMNRLVLLPIVLCGLLWATPAVAAPEGVGVVDMVDLISTHPRVKEIERKFEEAQASAQAYADAENEALRKLKAEIELMQQNNPLRIAKEKQFLAQTAMLKFEIEWRRDAALRDYMKGLESLYAEIKRLVQRYARDNNLSLVLQRPHDELEAADFNDFFAKVQLRSVLFYVPTMDITPQIKAMFAPAPPAPATPPNPR
ncbi:MAG: OmpH/Skp family outer membrane protein, partial [Planctomycetota bacterium]